jgi:cellulose synthase/poly-beta-1,6-N-acetylglucosamine synthase-like glycosyltransferase
VIQTTLLFGFYFFAVVSIYLGLLSLRGGVRFVRYLQSESSKPRPEFAPFVSVFFPLRGVDDGLSENIAAVFDQDYPSYEVIFVSDDETDPAWSVVATARQSFSGESGPAMQTVVAGLAQDRGQKVHNLTVATNHAHPNSLVFAFVDSDARPNREWLRNLVAHLHDETIGAATGYRWFVPAGGGFASHLRSVWNAAIASALGADEQKNFCWGGSTAIRRSVFEQCSVIEYWRGTVSDDFAVTRAMREAGLAIKFVPQCLTPSVEDCSLNELVEFTTRQLKITRAYATHLWKAVLFGSLIFVITFFGGMALVITRAFLHLPVATPLVLLLILFAMGAMKSHLRLRAVSAFISDPRTTSFISTLAHITLWPMASALYLYNGLAAIFSRRIRWRGITYELKSPNETVIIARQKSEVRSQKSE